MSVLIKGMEMPKRGHTVTITIVGSGQAYVEYYDCRPHVEETIEYTAVPVPPHGDLIDRKAAYDSILDGMVMTWYQSRALDCINEFYVPTIIEA